MPVRMNIGACLTSPFRSSGGRSSSASRKQGPSHLRPACVTPWVRRRGTMGARATRAKKQEQILDKREHPVMNAYG